MRPKLTLEHLIYTLVIILCGIVLILGFVSPPEFTQIKNTYQGF